MLVNTKTIMEILGLNTKSALDKLRAEGMPCYKLSYRTLRFDPEECKKWIEKNKKENN